MSAQLSQRPAEVFDLLAVVVTGETVVSADHIALGAAVAGPRMIAGETVAALFHHALWVAEGIAVETIVAAVLVDHSFYLFLIAQIFHTNRDIIGLPGNYHRIV
jgi:integral membrane sensor domain MASE1